VAQKHRFNNKRNRRMDSPRTDRRDAPPAYVPKPPVTYGKPLMILEDVTRHTFEFKGGSWVPFTMTIAECRKDCLVKELPQKINSMTRYEIRCPVPT